MAPASALIAIPAKIKVKERPCLPARSIIKNTAKIDIPKADKGKASQYVAAKPVCNDSTAPNEAEPEIPISPGSAKGLRK